MKTTLLLISLCLVLFQVAAQEYSPDFTRLEAQARKDVAAENRMLQRRLLLNEDQFKKVEAINKERNEMLDMVAGMYRFDPENYQKKALELELQYDAEFERVLTKTQYDDYIAMNGRNKLPETEELQLAGQPEEKAEPDQPTFNDQIHAILTKATEVKIDSSLIARQDTTQFELLSLEEEGALNGLLPQNATLLAIRADSAAKKALAAAQVANKDKAVLYQDSTGFAVSEADSAAQTVAISEEKVTGASQTDGECKTCFDVNLEEEVAHHNRRLAKNKTSLPAAVNPQATQPDNETVTDSLITDTQEEDTEEQIAIEPKQPETNTEPGTIAVETSETPETEGMQPENLLALPAGEVEKLQQSLGQPTKQIAREEENAPAFENDSPQLNEPQPLNKSLAEEIEP